MGIHHEIFAIFIWISLVKTCVYAESKNVTCSRQFEDIDFYGNDITWKRGPPERCCQYCHETPGCKGYSWIDYGRGGECYLKSRVEFQTTKTGIISGIIDNPTLEPPGHYLPDGQDNTKTWKVDESFTKIRSTCKAITKLLIGVVSRPSEFELRRWIRETWGHPDRMSKRASLIFILADSQNKTIEDEVLKESKKYQDVLKLDFKDSYWNLTLKIFGLIKYANDNCKNLKCLQKTDSDAIVNIQGLESLCNSMPDREHVFTGMVWREVDFNRNPNARFYVPWYVDSNKLAPDAPTGIHLMIHNVRFLGLAYLMSGYRITERLLKALADKTSFYTSENTRRLMEDTLFAGRVRELAGIRVQDIGGYNCCGNDMRFWCDNSTNFSNTPIAFEVIPSETTKEKAWKQMQVWSGEASSCRTKSFWGFLKFWK